MIDVQEFLRTHPPVEPIHSIEHRRGLRTQVVELLTENGAMSKDGVRDRLGREAADELPELMHLGQVGASFSNPVKFFAIDDTTGEAIKAPPFPSDHVDNDWDGHG